MTHPRLVRFTSRESWLEARRAGVGGSDAPIILGMSPWSAPLALYLRKVGLVEDNSETEAMKWGSILEPIIVRELSAECGRAIEHLDHAIIRHPTHEGLFCSPDGFCDDGALVEAKNVNAFKVREWDEGPPPLYEEQIQHSLSCVPEAPYAIAAALIGGSALRWCRVERDASWEERNLPALLDFARRIREEDPPEASGHEADTEALSTMFPRAEAMGVSELPPEALDWHEELECVKAERKRLDERWSELRNRLREKIGMGRAGSLPGGTGFYLWRQMEKKGYFVKARTESRLEFTKRLKEEEE